MSGDEEIDQHDVLFSTPLQFFVSSPYNDTFTEMREDVVYAHPKDKFSDVYTFTRHGNTVGLMKTSDAKIIGKFSVRRSTDDTIQENGVIVLPPVPLRTFWKTIQVKLNESLVTPADNFAYMGNYLSFLTRETPDMYVDSKEVNCSFLDTQGEMNTRVANDLGSLARHALTNDSVTTLIDRIDCAGFSENGGVTYIPSAFKTEIRLKCLCNEN